MDVSAIVIPLYERLIKVKTHKSNIIVFFKLKPFNAVLQMNKLRFTWIVVMMTSLQFCFDLLQKPGQIQQNVFEEGCHLPDLQSSQKDLENIQF